MKCAHRLRFFPGATEIDQIRIFSRSDSTALPCVCFRREHLWSPQAYPTAIHADRPQLDRTARAMLRSAPGPNLRNKPPWSMVGVGGRETSRLISVPPSMGLDHVNSEMISYDGAPNDCGTPIGLVPRLQPHSSFSGGSVLQRISHEFHEASIETTS